MKLRIDREKMNLWEIRTECRSGSYKCNNSAE